MKSPPPSYTPRQLKTATVLQRNQMAWVMFWFVLGVFAIIFGFFLYAAFWAKAGAATQAVLGGLDAILAYVMKPLVSFLFSPEKPSAGQS